MIAGLILAAGESRRMGRDKALLTYRGRTFLETIISSLASRRDREDYRRTGPPRGHHSTRLQAGGRPSGRKPGLPARANVITSTGACGGSKRTHPEAVILCLVDHPTVSSGVVAKLVERFQAAHSPVLIPTYSGERGHPILISQALFPELLAVPAGQPANTVIRAYRDATEFVEVADRGILLDVDEPETYEQLERGKR